MGQKIKFTKMHGAGNDYIYVDTLKYDIPHPSAASIAWSNRHMGIGSDGLVLIGKPTVKMLTTECASSTLMVPKQ